MFFIKKPSISFFNCEMKRISTLIFFVMCILGFSQVKDTIVLNKKPARYFIGLGTGVNAHTGFLGIASELPIHQQFFARLGFGLGGWGPKLSLGFNVHNDKKSGIGIALYYNHSFGINNVKTELEFIKSAPVLGVQDILVKEKVSVNYLTASSFNLGLSYNWLLNKGRGRLYLELSYGRKNQEAPYKISGDNISGNYFGLSENSKKALRLAQPGGVGIAVGYMFGF
jgi:hypothetical protein